MWSGCTVGVLYSQIGNVFLMCRTLDCMICFMKKDNIIIICHVFLDIVLKLTFSRVPSLIFFCIWTSLETHLWSMSKAGFRFYSKSDTIQIFFSQKPQIGILCDWNQGYFIHGKKSDPMSLSTQMGFSLALHVVHHRKCRSLLQSPRL